MSATPEESLTEETDNFEAVRVEALWEPVEVGDHVRVEHPAASKGSRYQGVVRKRARDGKGNVVLALDLDEFHPDYGSGKCVFEWAVLRVGTA